MIVMKFGGSSLESAPAILRVTEIVKSQLHARPVVVVSAMGKTTDSLLKLAVEAEHGRSYLAWKGLKDLWEYHSETAARVSSGESLEWLDKSLHQHFNYLHRLFVKMEDESGELTPALKDEIASHGERLSSEVLAAALQCAGVPSIHLDARQLILTDDQFTRATPLYWETYAKLRRTVPRLAENRTVVMGGFIGATESGVTTTLGRGGSDLTASIVGAGISADEIQIWTDVDGMLTCDPKLFENAYRLKSISYHDASAMAQAGAKVLHPDTIRPAIRQNIPIVIRNSRRPDVAGTRISGVVETCRNRFKSIAAKQQVTVLEIRLHGDAGSSLEDLKQLCGRGSITPELIASAGDVVYLCVEGSDRIENLQLDLQGCVEVRLHPERAILTLVGAARPASEFARRVIEVLNNPEAFVIPGQPSELALTVMVPQRDLRKSVEALHKEFFAQVDPTMFAEVDRRKAADRVPPRTEVLTLRHTGRKQTRLIPAHLS